MGLGGWVGASDLPMSYGGGTGMECERHNVTWVWDVFGITVAGVWGCVHLLTLHDMDMSLDVFDTPNLFLCKYVIAEAWAEAI